MLNRSFTPLLAIALAATLTGCARNNFDAAAETSKVAHGLLDAYNRGDAHAAAAFDAPDYVGIFHGTPNVIGLAADEAGMKKGMAAAKLDWQIGAETVAVAKSGDLAVFEAPYAFTISAPGAAATHETGTWTAIFKRQPDGSLKLWRSIASNLPAKP